MKVVILAGGFGTRISEESHLKPKPMIEIGEKPILWHIMKYYSEYGYHDFVICLGYKQYVVKEFFADYFLHTSDVTFDLANNRMEVHNNYSEPWKVTLVDTGLNTMTGGRVKRIQPYIGNEPFMLTYGDGVSNVDLKALVDFHRSHKKTATITTVNLGQSKGVLNIDDNNSVLSFREKDDNDGALINGGFMVLNPEVFDYLKDDAIEKILMNWEKYKKKNTIGIIGYKERTSGECVTSFSNSKIDKATLRQFYDSGLQGDTILVYRTDILKRYSFPQFKGEKFIPEAYLYDLLDQEGKLILIREALYVCEYLEDGYSANMAQLLYNNPQGYFCYINQRLKFDTTIKQKCADTIRYLAMAIAHSEKNIIKNSIYPVLTVGLYGAGYIFYFKRYRKFAIRNGK